MRSREPDILSQVPPARSRTVPDRELPHTRRDRDVPQHSQSPALAHAPDVLQLHTERSLSLQERRRRRLILLAATASNRPTVPQPLGRGGGCVRRVYVPFSRRPAGSSPNPAPLTDSRSRRRRCQHNAHADHRSDDEYDANAFASEHTSCERSASALHHSHLTPRETMRQREKRWHRLRVDTRSAPTERGQRQLPFHGYHVSEPSSSSRNTQDLMERHYKRNLGYSVLSSPQAKLAALDPDISQHDTLSVSRVSTNFEHAHSAVAQHSKGAKKTQSKIVKVSPTRQIRACEDTRSGDVCAVQMLSTCSPTLSATTAAAANVNVPCPMPNDSAPRKRFMPPPRTAPSSVRAQHSAHSMVRRQDHARLRLGRAGAMHQQNNVDELPLLSLYSSSTTSGTLRKQAAGAAAGLRTQSALVGRELVHLSNSVPNPRTPNPGDHGQRQPCSLPRPIHRRDSVDRGVFTRGVSPARFPDIRLPLQQRSSQRGEIQLRAQARSTLASDDEAREIASLRSMLHEALPPRPAQVQMLAPPK